MTNTGSDSVSVIDGTNNTLLATVAVGVHPADAGVNASTNRIYVANTGSDSVSVIATPSP